MVITYHCAFSAGCSVSPRQRRLSAFVSSVINLFILDVSPVDSTPIPTSTVRMDTMKGICLNSASDIPNSFDTNIMGSTNIADVDGSSLQGLEIHAMGGNKEDLSQIF